MPLDTDLFLDRRRLKRLLSFWRIVAVLAVLAVGALAVGSHGGWAMHGRHIVRLRVTGVIADDPKLIEEMDRAAKDRHVAAMIVDINSPGGSVGGGEALHDAIARFAAHKPVAAVMESMAASAGYMVALPARRIFARPGTLTGAIGVFLEAPELSGLLGKLGVGVATLVSGPLKDQPSLTHPLSPEGRVVMQGIVDDLAAQFMEMVAAGRHMEIAKVRTLADGRPYTGRQALALGLIDAYGDEHTAKTWLETQKSVGHDLPIQTLHQRGWPERILDARGLTEWLADGVREALFGPPMGDGGSMPMMLFTPGDVYASGSTRF